MDKDKEIQKVPKLSLEKLSEDSSLAKRGLRDIGIWPKIQILLKEIQKQYFAHNYQKCIDLCDEVLASEPMLYVPLSRKALCLLRLEKYEEAIIWFDKALQTELPLETTPQEQKYEKDELVNTKPDFEIVIGNKGFCFLKLEKYKEAIDCLDQALKIFPNNYVNLSNKAFCLEKLGRKIDALDFYEKSLILQPSNDKYYDFQGSVDGYFELVYKNNTESDFLMRVDNFYDLDEKGISFLLWNKFLEEKEKNLQTLLQKAKNLFDQEKYSQAIDIFSICIEKNDKISYAWQFRGDCYWKIREFSKAIKDYLKSIELDPTNAAAYDNAAMCFSLLADHAKAHEYIDKAISLETTEDMPMIRKAQFFEYQEKKTEALEQYKKTLDRFPNSEYARKKVLELST